MSSVSCSCSNLRLRMVSLPENVTSAASSLCGPVTLGLGGASSVLGFDVEESDGVFTKHSCFNCGTMVYAVRNSDGAHFVNGLLLSNGTSAPPSEDDVSSAFGLKKSFLTSSSNAKSNKELIWDVSTVGSMMGRHGEVKTRIQKMLESHKERVEQAKQAKVREFAEKCEREAQREVEEATQEALVLWERASVALEKKQQQQAAEKKSPVSISKSSTVPTSAIDIKVASSTSTNTASDAPPVVVKGVTWAPPSRLASREGPKSKMGASRGKDKSSSSSSNNNNNNNNVSPSRNRSKTVGSYSDSLWALDEELTESPGQSSTYDLGWKGVPDKDPDSENDDLNTSEGSGALLPSTKRLLFGGQDEESSAPPPSAKMTMAHSLPVSIPAWSGPRVPGASQPKKSVASSSVKTAPAVAPAADDDADGPFERPDLLAPNTWQEQVRSDWVEQSQRRLKAGVRVDSVDDLDFLVAAADLPSAGARRNNFL